MNRNGGIYAIIKQVQPQPSPFQGENVGKIYQTWNFGSILEHTHTWKYLAARWLRHAVMRVYQQALQSINSLGTTVSSVLVYQSWNWKVILNE